MADAYVGAALISEAEAASRLRELRVFAAGQRERVGTVISGALSQWQSEWDWRGAGAEASALQVRVSDALDPAYANAWNKKWMVCEFAGHGAGLPNLRWQLEDGEVAPGFPQERFAACLWGAVKERQLPEPSAAPGSMAAEMASAMWQDFWRHLANACAPHHGIEVAVELAADVTVRTDDWPRPDEFSGVLLAGFHVAGLQWTVALEAASVDAILAKSGEKKPDVPLKPLKPADLVRVDAALGQRTLALDAYLRPCTLSLGALQSLRVGDVIALEHPLDQPAQVFSESREKVAQAWMTQTNGFKSLELASTQQ